MKRGPTLLIILCVLLIIPSIILGARDKPFHLFWNLPFGLKIENCLSRLRGKPYEFVEVPTEREGGALALLSAREPDVYFMGYPVDVALLFTSSLYNEACVMFRYDEAVIDALESTEGVSEEEAGAHLEKTLRTYFDLLDQLNAGYPLQGGPFILTAYEGEERVIPMRGAEEDREEIADWMRSIQTGSLSVQYGKLSVAIDKSVSVSGEKQFPFYSVSMRYEGDAFAGHPAEEKKSL